MRRRDFITFVGGAAVTTAWPLILRAQESSAMRRMGALLGVPADDPEARVRVAAFLQGLQQLGWIVGGNLRIDFRWAAGSSDELHKYATELVGLAPEVIFAGGGTSLGALLQATGTTPIVFAVVPDPVGSGFVDSLARPGRNATGFMQFEYSLSGKWLELLKQIAPGLTRAGILWDPAVPAGIGQFAVIQSIAPSLGVELTPVNVRNAAEIERSIAEIVRSANTGLIVTASALALVQRDLIVKLAAKHKVPAIYFQREFVDNGGLISYGSNWVDQYRRAATYVDRILKGEKPANLPVQAPTKYELIINLKIAKAMGLTLPPTLLARADEVAE